MGHGRIETRTCKITNDVSWVCKKEHWAGLKTLICIESQRISKATGESQNHTRYFISSKDADATVFNNAVREHWGIENKLHWTLDVAFGEDSSNKCAGHAAENFSFISRVALNILNQHRDYNGKKSASMKTKRKKSGWDNEYLGAVMAGVEKLKNS